MSLFFLKEKFCLISGVKFTLSHVTSFLPDNLSWLKKKNYIQVWRDKWKTIYLHIYDGQCQQTWQGGGLW